MKSTSKTDLFMGINGRTHFFNSDDKEDEIKEFFKSIKSRLTVAQVVEGVKANARLTFDYISLVILAR